MKRLIGVGLLIGIGLTGSIAFSFPGGGTKARTAKQAEAVNTPQTGAAQGVTMRGPTGYGSVRMEAALFQGYTTGYRLGPLGLERCRWNGMNPPNSALTNCEFYAGSGGSAASFGGLTGAPADNVVLAAALNAKAPLASPALTGTPTAPTAAPGTNTTQLANTAFVQAAVDAGVAGVTVSGINISTATPSTPGQANLNDTTHELLIASATGVTAFTGTFTAWDTTPAAFSFTDVTDATTSTPYESNVVDFTGINYPATVSITGGEWAKSSDGGSSWSSWSASSGTVANNDKGKVKQTSSNSGSTTTNTVLTVGGVSDTYSVTTAASIAWTDVGWNFRNTQAYVTDQAGETYVNSADIFPVSRLSAEFGWVSAPQQSANNNAGLERRLAGTAIVANNGSPKTFRVTLPSPGTYKIWLAIGDVNARPEQYVRIFDNATLSATISGATTSYQWLDAVGAAYSQTTWPTSNTPITVTFASTTCNITVGTVGTGSGGTTLSHVRLQRQ